MNDNLIAPTFLFRFSAPLFYRETVWTDHGIALEDKYILPCFAELDSKRAHSEVRGCWNEQGLTFTVRVEGKRQPPWCKESALADSDGFRLWIDTRATHNIHRASRFCHSAKFLPAGGGRMLEEPVAEPQLISRARENPKPAPHGAFQVRSEKRVDGYLLQAHVPAHTLTGYDPGEYDRLGFFYAVCDRELPWQTFTVGPEFPIAEDPSVWATLELTK